MPCPFSMEQLPIICRMEAIGLKITVFTAWLMTGVFYGNPYCITVAC